MRRPWPTGGLLGQKQTKLGNLAGNPEHCNEYLSVIVESTFFNTPSTGTNSNIFLA